MIPGPGETLDSIVHPDLLVLQKSRGYRFTLDPLLLVAFPDTPPPSPAMDLGCGSGIITLLAARRWATLQFVGLEIQEDLARMAGRNVRLNGLSRRVCVVRGDIRNCPDLFRAGRFGSVFCNPPYRKPGTGRLPPDPERAVARHAILLPLEGLLAAIRHLLAADGPFFLSWKPNRLEELSRRCRDAGLGLKRLRFLHSREGDEPFLVLIEGYPAPPDAPRPQILPPLVVRRGTGYSPAVEHVLRHGCFPSC